MKADNIILAGVWVGPHKPSMKLLLQPVMDDLNCLCRDGLTVMLPNGSEDFKAKLVFAVFYLAAKASVLNCSSSMENMAVVCATMQDFVSLMGQEFILHLCILNVRMLKYFMQLRKLHQSILQSKE